MQLFWNPQAENDLQSIKSFHRDAGLSPEVIERIIKRILTAVDRLKHSPPSGRIVPKIDDPDFREVIWKNWRIIYLLPNQSEQPIEILNVIHSARQLGSY